MTSLSKAPIHPIGDAVSVGWGKISNIMKWFTKLVQKAYTYSDMFIDMRQQKADRKYKFEKAEAAALKIMEEQQRKRSAATVGQIGKRSFVEDDVDVEEFAEFLNDLIKE